MPSFKHCRKSWVLSLNDIKVLGHTRMRGVVILYDANERIAYSAQQFLSYQSMLNFYASKGARVTAVVANIEFRPELPEPHGDFRDAPEFSLPEAA